MSFHNYQMISEMGRFLMECSISEILPRSFNRCSCGSGVSPRGGHMHRKKILISVPREGVAGEKDYCCRRYVCALWKRCDLFLC